ncbi:MAG: hypothetical protein K1060chlam1_00841 [Candidatus Anoxychlamydiales bacterium]|nr:hypothetical protein [Candidatus Anoxychlamydiales bacterium]
MAALARASSAEDTSELSIENITCPITQDVLIEPYKITCIHIIERLALAKHLQHDNKCPICRTTISSAIPDTELAKKIQELFVKVSDANKQTFEDQKKYLEEDKDYDDVREKLICELLKQAKPRCEPDDTSEADILSAASSDSILRRRARARIRVRLPTYSLHLYTQIQEWINSDNLFYAEIITDALSVSNIEGLLSQDDIDKSYEKIAKAFIKKANTNISNLEDSIRICKKITKSNLKCEIFPIIAIKYAEHKEYLKAFQSVKNIPNYFFRSSAYIFISLIVTCHGFLFILKRLYGSIKDLKAKLRLMVGNSSLP